MKSSESLQPPYAVPVPASGVRIARPTAADSIVVYSSKKQEVTIALVPETIIRKGQTTLTPADLTVDTRVHVKARFADDVYTAVVVIVQEEDEGEEPPPAATREYEGRVTGATLWTWPSRPATSERSRNSRIAS